MLAITSISPHHANGDIQAVAVQSWIDLGLKVVSINSRSECAALKPLYPNITFVETTRTMSFDFGKPYVALNSILDYCKYSKETHFCIINSDIELKADKETVDRLKEKMNNTIVLANRVNYDQDHVGNRYLDGIDVFFIHRNWLGVFPESMYCLGQCFWDYHIPYTAIKSGVEVVFIEQNIAYHKNHNVQYSHDNWLKTGRFFQWQNGLYQFSSTQGIGQMSKYVYNYIYSACRRIKI